MVLLSLWQSSPGIPGILILQNSKRDLANAALSGQTGKGVMKLTMDDIMSMLSTLPCLIGH